MLAQRLCELWAWGLLSAALVQYLADGCVKYGSAHTQVEQLSCIGAGGDHVKNCRRDLLRYVTRTKKHIVSTLPLEIHMRNGCMLSEESACIISPCEVVEQIFEHQRDFFEAAHAHNVRAL